MLGRLERKIAIIGILCLIGAVLAAGLALPVVRASAAEPTSAALGTPLDRNVVRVSGNITVLSAGSFTVTADNGSVVGPLDVTDNTTFTLQGVTLFQSGTTPTLTVPLTGQITVVYDVKTKEAIQVTMIVLPPPRIPEKTPIPPQVPDKNFMGLSGNITALSQDSVTVVLTRSADSLKVGQTVVIMTSLPPTPKGTPNLLKGTNALIPVSGNITRLSSDNRTIIVTLNKSVGNLTVGEAVVIIPSFSQVPKELPNPRQVPKGIFGGLGVWFDHWRNDDSHGK